MVYPQLGAFAPTFDDDSSWELLAQLPWDEAYAPPWLVAVAPWDEACVQLWLAAVVPWDEAYVRPRIVLAAFVVALPWEKEFVRQTALTCRYWSVPGFLP